jgi:hypothetical protein
MGLLSAQEQATRRHRVACADERASSHLPSPNDPPFLLEIERRSFRVTGGTDRPTEGGADSLDLISDRNIGAEPVESVHHAGDAVRLG